MAHKYVEYKAANGGGIVKIVSNRGIAWQVQDDEGNLFLVQKKLVVRGPWEEDESDSTPTPAPVPGSLAGQLTAAVSASKPPKKAAASDAADPDLVTLKQLCFELDLEPRIARRRLRGSLGTIGTGSRWEWKRDTEELNKVRALLVK